MVTIEQYGRITSAESASFINARNDADKLVKGLTQFNGILEKDAFITKIDAANILIDNLVTFQTTLNSIKTALQAA
jgi:hypothetical protein